jgi:hypothetical protein
MVSKTLIGAAGVHFVVSELSFRGFIALPTIRNTAGIDILVSEPDGSRQANLQVKTRSKKSYYWPTSKPDKCLKGDFSFYVFVRYLHDEKKFEAFLESGSNVAKQVRGNLSEQRKLGKRDFPYWRLPDLEEDIEEFRNKWRDWRPPKIKRMK